LSGLVEVRGLGIVRSPSLAFAPIDLVARCVAAAEGVERMPENGLQSLLGVMTPTLDLFALEASAPAKLRRALEHLGRGGARAYQTPLAQGRPCATT
jgi:serine kinase of HPr protein (carbohydrate metabolism regulator)